MKTQLKLYELKHLPSGTWRRRLVCIKSRHVRHLARHVFTFIVYVPGKGRTYVSGTAWQHYVKSGFVREASLPVASQRASVPQPVAA